MTVPLYVVFFGALMVGVVIGSLSTWAKQGRFRRAARVNRKEAARWRVEAERLKEDGAAGSAATAPPGRTGSPGAATGRLSPPMRVVTAEEIASVLTPEALIEALDDAFRAPIEVPLRHHHTQARRGEDDATLLLMPAWHGAEAPGRRYTGIKIVSVVPGNARRHLSTVVGSYLLLSGETGEPVAVLDGRELTLRRTAAASALAALRLARQDARRMLMVGAGALAPYLIRAHAARRAITDVAIWNRDPAKAEALAARLAQEGVADRSVSIRAVADLDVALGEADIVSAATLAAEPLIRGARLRPGCHVDLVGGFTPDMREADDEAVRRADVYVDTDAALKEAGDVARPLQSGVIVSADIRGTLFDLARGLRPGRSSDDAITLFKSVGSAIEDLAAAVLVHERLGVVSK